MSQTKVPGSQVTAAEITPECRTNRGIRGAWEVAAERLREEYWAIIDHWADQPGQPTFHLVLTMERPAPAPTPVAARDTPKGEQRMNPISVPGRAKTARPHCKVVAMGPPSGVSDDDCGTAEMLIAPPEAAPVLGIGRGQYAYFRPSEADLAKLNAGGFIEFCQYGQVVQPFGALVWDA